MKLRAIGDFLTMKIISGLQSTKKLRKSTTLLRNVTALVFEQEDGIQCLETMYNCSFVSAVKDKNGTYTVEVLLLK